jgi:Tol biopolymer transport system component
MWRRLFGLVVVGSAGVIACGSFGSDASSGPTEPLADASSSTDVGDTSTDGGGDGGGDGSAVPRCDVGKPFTDIASVLGPDNQPIAYPASAFAPTLTADESTLIFSTPAPDGGSMLVAASRAGASFSAPQPIPAIPQVGRDTWPSLRLTGDLLVFATDRSAPGLLAPLLFHGVPRFADGGFGAPFRLDSLAAGASSDATPFLSADGSELFFSAIRGSAQSPDIFRATRQADGGFGDPQPVEVVNTIGGEEYSPVLSGDGLTLYFSSDRNFARVSTIFVARRDAPGAPFHLPVVVPELDNGLVRNAGWLSPDQCRLYFQSVVGDGRFGIYVASRSP